MMKWYLHQYNLFSNLGLLTKDQWYLRKIFVKSNERSFLQYVKCVQDSLLLKLSSRQITLLLTSIWAQGVSPENTPANYEAIAHTYSLLLLFSGCKVIYSSNHILLFSSSFLVCLSDRHQICNAKD
jgi:hypothetical protein